MTEAIAQNPVTNKPLLKRFIRFVSVLSALSGLLLFFFPHPFLLAIQAVLKGLEEILARFDGQTDPISLLFLVPLMFYYLPFASKISGMLRKILLKG